MSELLKNTISNAILCSFDFLRRQAKKKRYTSNEPLPFALAGVLIVSGNDLEAAGFRKNSWYETQVACRLFRTTATVVAKRLLQAHPDLEEEVLTHEYIKDHLKTAPLKRLSRDIQAIKSLRVLLRDSSFFIQYQKRNLFGWDNGDAQGAMAIVYGWRKAVTKGRGIFQSVSEIHKDARKILTDTLNIHNDNPFLQIIGHRFKLSWDSDARVKSAKSISALEELSGRGGPHDRDIGIKLFSLRSLADFGLRYSDPSQALNSINNIEQILAPSESEQHHILLYRAWAEARGGDLIKARQLSTQLSEDPDSIVRVRAAQILMSIGDVNIGEAILKKVDVEFVPRANPLASLTLIIP
jgi:hypothetical protein